MADNLYDTGAPKRVIVEHRFSAEDAANLVRELIRAGMDEIDAHMQAERHARRRGPVTITPEFQPVEEKKLLK